MRQGQVRKDLKAANSPVSALVKPQEPQAQGKEEPRQCFTKRGVLEEGQQVWCEEVHRWEVRWALVS